MSTIVLKTANRTTRVSRQKIRRAVAAVYSAANSIPVPVKRKSTAAKKAATK